MSVFIFLSKGACVVKRTKSSDSVMYKTVSVRNFSININFIHGINSVACTSSLV